MSRKWSLAAEVARDKLFDQLMFSGLGAAERWQLIDNFAHALAEQIRNSEELRDYTDDHMSDCNMAADLIDPRPASTKEGTA